jgi:hypothetical protein
MKYKQSHNFRSYEFEETYFSCIQFSLWEGGVIYWSLTETEDVRK